MQEINREQTKFFIEKPFIRVFISFRYQDFIIFNEQNLYSHSSPCLHSKGGHSPLSTSHFRYRSQLTGLQLMGKLIWGKNLNGNLHTTLAQLPSKEEQELTPSNQYLWIHIMTKAISLANTQVGYLPKSFFPVKKSRPFILSVKEIN